jgi:hypothetical protein
VVKTQKERPKKISQTGLYEYCLFGYYQKPKEAKKRPEANGNQSKGKARKIVQFAPNLGAICKKGCSAVLMK